MKIPKHELVVLDIAGDQARLYAEDAKYEAALITLGFLKEGDQFVRSIVGDSDRQALINELIEREALFSAGRDWSPSELVEFYREQGLIKQKYRMIKWKDGEHYEISEQ